MATLQEQITENSINFSADSANIAAVGYGGALVRDAFGVPVFEYIF